ncbi:MAG TPA: DUF4058 family protein [Gemmataceae bacterium]|nr:DUF4058 family protein [Gemmataceae bacterium]
MPLLDHFHAPLDPRIGWESFHHRWANAIADHLDTLLPPQFFARVEVHVGNEVATDVSEEEFVSAPGTNGTGATAVATFTAPPPTFVIPAVFPPEAAVEVRSADTAARLLAVIELVSPANKRGPDARRAFVNKAAAFLQHGVGLVIVDPVTERHFNLHNELSQELTGTTGFELAGDATIYAASYRPNATEVPPGVDAWVHALTVGAALPVVPLFLRGHGLIPLDLEATYTETRRRIRF